jgi:phage shock protein A
MGLLDRLVIVKSNIRAMIEADDPEKILARSVNDMQETLARYHQNLAQSIADLNLHEQQCNQSATQAQEKEKQAILAIQNGDENLAREALSQMRIHLYSVMAFNARLDEKSGRVESFKRAIEMQTELVQLRQTLEQSMATLKHKDAEYNQCTLQLQEWDQRSLLALQNGDENLANENLRQKENYGSLAETLKSELDFQLMQIDTLKKDFIAIKRKIIDATAIGCSFIKLPPLESGVDLELAALKAKIMESCSSESSAFTTVAALDYSPQEFVTINLRLVSVADEPRPLFVSTPVPPPVGEVTTPKIQRKAMTWTVLNMVILNGKTYALLSQNASPKLCTFSARL